MNSLLSKAQYHFSNTELEEIRSLLEVALDNATLMITAKQAMSHIATINQILAARK